MQVRFSQEAIRYVERERHYLAQFGRRTAVAFSDQIKKAARLIGDHPHIGVASHLQMTFAGSYRHPIIWIT